jgi:hypothetical protein
MTAAIRDRALTERLAAGNNSYMTIKRYIAKAWLAAIDAFDRNCVPCGSPGLRCMVSRGNQAELAAPDRQSSDYDLELQRMTTEQAHPGRVIGVLPAWTASPQARSRASAW